MVATLRGLGVSPGVAAGPAYAVAAPPPLPAPARVSDVAAETARAVSALDAVAAELTRRAGAARQPAAADVLLAQSMMAGDPVLREAVAEGVGAGMDAPHAIDTALAAHRAAFEAAGGYLAERATDLNDLRDRAVAFCLGRPMPGIPDPGHPFVLLARDLSPADTTGLDPRLVLALVTEEGGPTSHTAILARAAGIPAVVGCRDILAVEDGVLVCVDGATGRVEAGIDDARVVAVRAEQEREAARLAAFAGPGRTADGFHVPLLANIGTAAELAAAPDAEGVGLLRSELLYLDRADPPGLDEQVAAYTAVLAEAAGRKVVVRTLDAGADKPLPFLGLPDEPNPALGMRGLRLARRGTDLLHQQLSAIAEAARGTDAEVWVMAPMVATVAEATTFVRACRAVGLPTAGVMVEVPSAALMAGELLTVVDFLSVGTNDLSQYTFAADRQCGQLADLLDPWQPALLRLVAACARAGRDADKPVGVCGEAAADPDLAVVLAGLGVTTLSMSARAMPAVRAALASHDLADCQRLAGRAVAATDPAAARAVVAG